jgi:hypothetical protein
MNNVRIFFIVFTVCDNNIDFEININFHSFHIMHSTGIYPNIRFLRSKVNVNRSVIFRTVPEFETWIYVHP